MQGMSRGFHRCRSVHGVPYPLRSVALLLSAAPMCGFCFRLLCSASACGSGFRCRLRAVLTCGPFV